MTLRNSAARAVRSAIFRSTSDEVLAGDGVHLTAVPAALVSSAAWPDIAVAAVIAYLGLSAAVRVTRQALEEVRSTSAVAAAE